MSKRRKSLGITKKDLIEYIEALAETQLAKLGVESPDEEAE